MVVLYNAFRMEIGNYFFFGSQPPIESSLFLRNIIWQINYSLFFLTVLSFANIRYLKNTVLGFINLGLNGFVAATFLSAGLLTLAELREETLKPLGIISGASLTFLRYISIGLLAGLLFSSYRYIKQEFLTRIVPAKVLQFCFDIAVSFIGLVVLSSELMNWADIFGLNKADKLGLSIFWGVYAIALIGLGIVWRKKHVRIFAIGLFAVTLLKLFLYDIANLDTISKTIVFVSIGILLLGASFLYNKYTKLIFDEELS